MRIEYAGALCHVSSRGKERKAIYREESNFKLFLDTVAEACDRFNWVIHSWRCLMTNHYHLVIETPDGNLSAGNRHWVAHGRYWPLPQTFTYGQFYRVVETFLDLAGLG